MKPLPLLLLLLLAPGTRAAQSATTLDAARRLNPDLTRQRVALSPSVAARAVALPQVGQFHVPVSLGTVPIDTQEVVVKQGSSWAAVANAFEISGGKTNLVVQPNSQYILRPKAAETARALSQSKDFLPGLLVRTSSAAPGAAPEVLTGQLFLQPRRMPLPWDAGQQSYTTKLVVGLDLTNRTTSLPLDPPVTVQFFPTGSDVHPAQVVLTNTGADGYREVDLVCSRQEKPASVKVHSSFGEVSYDGIGLEVALKSFQITPAEDRIPGWGLGTTSISLQCLAQDGQPLPAPEALTVQFTAGGGAKVDAGGALTIPAGASATTVQLRSRGLGLRTFTATVGSITGTTQIQFTWPVGLLVAALIGGAAGGAARLFRKGKGRKPSPARNVIQGCLVGLVAVAAATAGLVIGNLPTPALGTELGAFVVAVLSGYYGTPLLDQLTATAFGKDAKP